MTQSIPALSSLAQGMTDYIAHLRELEVVFNEHAAAKGLNVTIKVDSLVDAVKTGFALTQVKSYFGREDDSGVLHAAQLKTAIDCIVELLDNPGRNGLVLGAMQSGKTTTSLALQFAGPVIYALTGRRIYPIYLTTSHTSQADQTESELNNFLNYYGMIDVVRASGQQDGLDEGFMQSPTIAYYRGHVLRGAFEDTYAGPQLEDFVQRRVRGQRVKQIADVCRRANQQGFEPVLMIDEPQHGASDRIATNEDGKAVWRACVLRQIFDSIDEAIGETGRHSFVGLSATPYDLHELDAIWVAKQYLTPAYRGFNYFGHHTISEGVEIEPPTTLGFSDLASRFKLPRLAILSMSAYRGTPARFARFANQVGFTGSQDDYRKAMDNVVRDAIRRMVKEAEGDEPIGICLRPLNNNVQAYEFVRRLNLEKAGIEVIHYSGADFSGKSVKRVIRARQHPDRPYVIVVTNRARMGDAFPTQVRWFIDLSERASDLNALLQGLLGRACGYGKKSTVVLSDDNAQRVDDYRRTGGGYFMKTSAHSVVAGGYRRGAPSNLIRLRADMNDLVVKKFFERLRLEVTDPVVFQDRATLQATRDRSGNPRMGPILSIATEEGLFEHLEKPDVARKLFPSLPGFKIVRAGGEAAPSRNSKKKLKYFLNRAGECRFTLRWSSGSGAHIGLAARGYGARDATDRARAGDQLEPQIHMEKFEAKSGRVIYDKDQPTRVKGHWRPYMITLPLVDAVRELREGIVSLPSKQNVHAGLMNDDERNMVDRVA